MSDKQSTPSSARKSSSDSTKASTPVTPSEPTVDEIEKLLNREASAFQREVEVERILKSFKLKYVCLQGCWYSLLIILQSPYDLLDLDISATPEEIKKKYRQLSLCMSYFRLAVYFFVSHRCVWDYSYPSR